MALQSSGSIKAREIASELGYTDGASTRIGDYRLNGGQQYTDGRILTINNISSADGARVAGTYTNIGFSRTTGEGTGMTFTVVVDGSGACAVTIVNGGVDNVVGDQIEIDDDLLGSGGGATLTFNVATINPGLKLPISGLVPVSGPIKFSDFYEARRTLIVDYFTKDEFNPIDAYRRFASNPKSVIGNFIQNNDNTSGRRVVIVVNKDIGSVSTGSTDLCALKTGTGWSSDTELEIIVGPEGEILGAGGNGGAGRNANSGLAGGDGTSGLGVQYEGTGGTKVTIQSGGRIAGGGGGGGGGGGAKVTQERFWGRGSTRRAAGGNGGGGAGLPAGSGGGATKLNGGTGTDGTNQGSNPGAEGGAGGDGGSAAVGGSAGTKGDTSGGEQENPAAYGGGGGGSAGAAIRRNVGFTVVIQNLGPPSQLVGSTSATGIT